MTKSGQIIIETAGVAVQGPIAPNANLFAVKAHPDNVDVIWVGNADGDVDGETGFPLDPGEGLTLPGTLNTYWFDADQSDDRVCWIILNI